MPLASLNAAGFHCCRLLIVPLPSPEECDECNSLYVSNVERNVENMDGDGGETAKKLCDIEKHMFEGKLVLLVDDGKPMKLMREDPTSQEEVAGHFEVSTRGAKVVVGSSVRGDVFVVGSSGEDQVTPIVCEDNIWDANKQ
ncbi:hypothetical protein Tco_0973974 [Tanacetum coccineum]|uniref:Uncharacterized protein n=1 Tax=Tanacetum coccineum TaxID=301880 RepID=A0ABQ5EB75_9ASTR